MERKKALLFSWHSAKNIELLLPLIHYLDHDCNFDVRVVTSDATGKIRFLQRGYAAYNVNELLLVYGESERSEYSLLAQNSDKHPIDLTLNWLYTPEDPVMQESPPRTATLSYFKWKHDRLFSAYVGFLQDLNPEVVMTWNGSLLVTRALAEAADSLSIETFFLERGLLPQSLVFDPNGVNSQSSLAGPDWNKTSKDAVPSDLKEHLKSYCNSLKSQHLSIVNSGNREDEIIIREKLALPQNKTIVLLPLQIETDSNIIENSPLYKKMTNLIFDVVQTLKNKDVVLIVKPHPEDTKRKEEIEEICDHDQIRVCWDIALPSILSLADLVVVINSTVGLEALIQNKPVITLGRSIYDRKGFTLDVSDRGELSKIIETGLEAPIYPHDVSDFWLFLLTLIRQHTFFFRLENDIDGREWLRNKLHNLRAKGATNLTPSLQALGRTNDQLLDIINSTEKGPHLIFGSIDSALESLPKEVRIITRQSAIPSILDALLHRYQTTVCMNMPRSRIFRMLFSLIRSKQKIILG